MKVPFPTLEGRLDQTARQAAWQFLVTNQRNATYFTSIWLTAECDRLGEWIVAKKAAATKGSKDEFGKAEWAGFADVPLSDSDKAAIRASNLAADDLFEGLLEMLAAGHKVSVSHDAKTGKVTAAATGAYRYCDNAGKTLTAQATSIIQAVTVLLYKHFTKCKGVWGDVHTPDDDDLA